MFTKIDIEQQFNKIKIVPAYFKICMIHEIKSSYDH